MDLPDLAPLAALSAKTWASFVERLRRLDLTPMRIAPVVTEVAQLHPLLRRPVRNRRLRRLRDATGYAMRMLMFQDPVGHEEAQTALGDALDGFVQSGLVRRLADGSFVSPFVLGVLDDLFVFSDDLGHGGDAVMGFSDGTIELCRAAFPKGNVGRVLDLGCGSGTCALRLAAVADHVVATDLNSRASTLTRLNALLNGIDNVAPREGDGFAPVAGDTFDLIVSQPPFIPMPDGASHASFLYGGAGGDEFALELLARIGDHLAPGGRAVLRVDWPEREGERLVDRLREAASEDLDVVLLGAPSVPAREHAVSYAAGIAPTLDAAFDAEATARLDHLERHGIRAFAPSLTIVHRAPAGRGGALRRDIAPLASARVTSAAIDALLAARALVGDHERLLASALRVPEGTTFAEEQLGPGAEVESTLTMRFADEALVTTKGLTAPLLFLLTCVHEAVDVRSGIEAFAAQADLSLDQARGRSLPIVAEALAAGMLRIAAPDEVGAAS